MTAISVRCISQHDRFHPGRSRKPRCRARHRRARTNPIPARCSTRASAHCAKKLGEEAVETVLAAVQEDKIAARSPRPPTCSITCSCCLRGARHLARRGGGGAGRRTAQSRPRRRRRRARADRRESSWNSARDDNLSPYRTFSARGMGGAARRHADDADLGGGDAAALAARPARHGRGRGHLSAAVAAAVDVRRGDPAAVPRAAALPRHRATPRCLT